MKFQLRTVFIGLSYTTIHNVLILEQIEFQGVKK